VSTRIDLAVYLEGVTPEARFSDGPDGRAILAIGDVDLVFPVNPEIAGELAHEMEGVLDAICQHETSRFSGQEQRRRDWRAAEAERERERATAGVAS